MGVMYTWQMIVDVPKLNHATTSFKGHNLMEKMRPSLVALVIQNWNWNESKIFEIPLTDKWTYKNGKWTYLNSHLFGSDVHLALGTFSPHHQPGGSV